MRDGRQPPFKGSWGDTLEKYDVVVVGAGPAGSTTARFAAGEGLSVLLLDSRREIGWPVQCGELMARTEEMKKIFPLVQNQEELFDVPSAYVSRPIDIIKMVSPSMHDYDIPFACFSTERRQFDKYQADLARKAGATVMQDTRLIRLEDNNVAVTTKGNFEGNVIVGADGPFSAVRRSLGLKGPELLYPAMSTTMDGEFSNDVYMYFGHVAPGGYGWIIPKSGGANVGLGADPKISGQSVGKYAKGFIADVANEHHTKPKQIIAGGWVPMSGPIQSTVLGDVMLVGDAAGHVMATNGGGIQISMICGRVAGKTIARRFRSGASLNDYDKEWRRLVGKDLATARKMMQYASVSFSRDWLMSAIFKLAGVKGLTKVIKCKSVFSTKDWS